jgi:hypothetical protein
MDTFYMGWLVPYSIAIPLFIAVLKYKYLSDTARIIFYYLIVSVIFTIIGYILRHTIQNNLPLLHIYTVVEFFILTEFFKKAINEKNSSKILTVVQIVFTLACIANVFFLQSLFTYNSYSRSLGALLIMLLAINFFARLFTKQLSEKVTKLPLFWFNSAIFLYFSGAFVLFIFSNYVLIADRVTNVILWNIHATFVLIMYLLFAKGFYKLR